eukprot:TRINITY_DN15035_c0_g1_i1.p1 TRINITY_DN15035_c0_g1~~TRINITY_DN15035_c0_g1_i1.p1  ORF type:complete len:447 (+),score=75.88 TRINITY_DN15035_c0_g1_i1:112-1452(+)
MDRIAVVGRHINPIAIEGEDDATTPITISPTLGQIGISSAFPQATTAAKFPEFVSDYFKLDEFLSEEERAVRHKVRQFMEGEVAPVMAGYWERAEFPHVLLPKFAQLKVAGTSIKGYGCPGLTMLGGAMVVFETARVDASCSTFIMVHSCLCMLSIALLGSEEQKQKHLPRLAGLDDVGAWALTEPDYGSDASSLDTTAVKVPGGWRLNGQKRWIGNATFADIIIIFARNTTTNQINGFIVKKSNPGYSATKIENKIGLRMVQNADIVLKDAFVPDEDRLPGVDSFQDTNKVLAISRIMVAWQPIGIAAGVYDMCARYLKERRQFGAPLAALQINQEKLVRILGNVQAMTLMGWRLVKLYEDGRMTSGQASIAKSWNTLRTRECVSLARELLGGNGILSDFLVAKAFCDLEPIYTYEGTYEVNALVTGREVTGISGIKAPLSFKSR